MTTSNVNIQQHEPVVQRAYQCQNAKQSIQLEDLINHSRQSSIQSNNSTSTITSGSISSAAPSVTRLAGGAQPVRKPTPAELVRVLKARDKLKHCSMPVDRSKNQSLPDLRVAAETEVDGAAPAVGETMLHSLSASSLQNLTNALSAGFSSAQQSSRLHPQNSSSSLVSSIQSVSTAQSTESLASRINSIDIDATDSYAHNNEATEGAYSVRYASTIKNTNMGETNSSVVNSMTVIGETLRTDKHAASEEAKKKLELLFSSRLREIAMQEQQKAEMTRRKLTSPSGLSDKDRSLSSNSLDADVITSKNEKTWVESDTCSVKSEPITRRIPSFARNIISKNNVIEPMATEASKQESIPAWKDEGSERRMNVKEMAARFERNKNTENVEMNERDNKRISNYCTLPRKRDKQIPPQKENARRVTFCDQVSLCSDSDGDSISSAPLLSSVPPKPALKMTKPRPEGGTYPQPVEDEGIRTLPCHLCRSKEIVPPAMYCSDCDFYMSRFKPKP